MFPPPPPPPRPGRQRKFTPPPATRVPSYPGKKEEPVLPGKEEKGKEEIEITLMKKLIDDGIKEKEDQIEKERGKWRDALESLEEENRTIKEGLARREIREKEELAKREKEMVLEKKRVEEKMREMEKIADEERKKAWEQTLNSKTPGR